jgi:DNA-binding response OmpR family regulator
MELTAFDTPNLQERRILVYDDDRLLLDVLVRMLGRQGCQVTGTPSEQGAIALVCTEQFDLAVVDLGRQRSKGYDLVRAIRERSQETPILAMSAYPAQEVVRFAREHAQAFLEKPFSLAELVEVMRCLLTRGQWAGETVGPGFPAGPHLRARQQAENSGAGIALSAAP